MFFKLHCGRTTVLCGEGKSLIALAGRSLGCGRVGRRLVNSTRCLLLALGKRFDNLGRWLDSEQRPLVIGGRCCFIEMLHFAELLMWLPEHWSGSPQHWLVASGSLFLLLLLFLFLLLLFLVRIFFLLRSSHALFAVIVHDFLSTTFLRREYGDLEAVLTRCWRRREAKVGGRTIVAGNVPYISLTCPALRLWRWAHADNRLGIGAGRLDIERVQFAAGHLLGMGLLMPEHDRRGFALWPMAARCALGLPAAIFAAEVDVDIDPPRLRH
mmetsp:Transcript_80482/g.167682  ORF Transcript_80482/g.167682 Transcript_80482/m.167682 type:complete len:269 (+) Transcript_80482:3244-4050(+)